MYSLVVQNYIAPKNSLEVSKYEVEVDLGFNYIGIPPSQAQADRLECSLCSFRLLWVCWLGSWCFTEDISFILCQTGNCWKGRSF